MHILFEKRLELAPNTWQYFFKPKHALQFEPGQYADVRLPGGELAPVDRSRTFTLTSLPTDSHLSFVTKVEPPISAYKAALQALRPGDPADLTQPMGDFILPKSTSTPLVFVASGIGIASYVSIARWLTQHKQHRPIALLYAVRQKSDIIFPQIFKDELLPEIIQTPQRLTAPKILQKATPRSLIYLSGSQNFVESLRNSLRDLGVENYRIIFEYYTGYADL